MNIQLTGWLRMHDWEVELEWDLESIPFEFKTDGDKEDELIVSFSSATGENAGEVTLRFEPEALYSSLGECNTMSSLPVKPPDSRKKVWGITLTRTAGVRLVIHCNEMEVLNKLLSSTCSLAGWDTVWNRDVTKIRLRSKSHYTAYLDRPQPGD